MIKWIRNIGIIGWIGILTTIAYALAMYWFIDGRWEELRQLKLNELGDFLAGAFGPLAILWLVLGFFQQGIELRQNSKALNLQAQELKNSVQQQYEIASTSKAQFDLDKAALEHEIYKEKQNNEDRIKSISPRFEITASFDEIVFHNGDPHERFLIKIHNHGHECTELKIIFTEEINFKINFLEKNKSFSFDLDIPEDNKNINHLFLRYFLKDHQKASSNYLIDREGNTLSFEKIDYI